jgi:hypothetical protein
MCIEKGERGKELHLAQDVVPSQIRENHLVFHHVRLVSLHLVRLIPPRAHKK